jgi:DNA polymerase/3'-5' exonuclease PolX
MCGMSKVSVDLLMARQIAGAVVTLLRPACERIEIAGSIRRRRPEVGDVEIVAEPRMEKCDFFGEVERSLLDDHLAGLVAEGMLWLGERGGERFKLYSIPPLGMGLDLFVVLPPATWGVIYAIRTGSADFSKMLVNRARARGMRVVGGALYDLAGLPEIARAAALAMSTEHFQRLVAYQLKPIPTPEEEDFFAALGVEWVAPEEREIGERVFR